ncbi:MAG: hypothetical protein ACMG6E_01195 [Candidatus Roizmanbacteria bacterium]
MNREAEGFNFLRNKTRDRALAEIEAINWQIHYNNPGRLGYFLSERDRHLGVSRMLQYLQNNVSHEFTGQGQCDGHYLTQLRMGMNWKEIIRPLSDPNVHNYYTPICFPEVSFPNLRIPRRSMKPDLVGIDHQGLWYVVEICSAYSPRRNTKKRGVVASSRLIRSNFPKVAVIPTFVTYRFDLISPQKTGVITIETILD